MERTELLVSLGVPETSWNSPKKRQQIYTLLVSYSEHVYNVCGN